MIVIITIIKGTQFCETCKERIEAFDLIKSKKLKFIKALGDYTGNGNKYYHFWKECSPISYSEIVNG